MIERIGDLPAGVLGFEAVGEVSADDYREVLVPAVAVVTDTGSIAHAVGAFGWMIPGEVRVFALAERADAEAWVAA